RDHHGHVGGSDVEAIEQLLDAGIAVQVEHGMGMSVAGEELADAGRPVAMTRAEDHDVADSARNQLHPPQDEGAHEDRAQLAVGSPACTSTSPRSTWRGRPCAVMRASCAAVSVG